MLLLMPTLILSFLFLYLVYALLSRAFPTRRSSSGKLPLPPGSMGWPYVGETFQLYSNNPNTFFALKQKRSVSIHPSHFLPFLSAKQFSSFGCFQVRPHI